MRSPASPILAGLFGAFTLLALPGAAHAQTTAPSAAAATPAPTAAKTLFLIRDPDGVTPIRSVSYQVQGPVVVLVNESGGRAVVQTSTVIGRIPWVSEAEIRDGSADLESLARMYENYALRVPLARPFLNREAIRFREILRARAAEQAARQKAAAEQLAALTAETYRPETNYTPESLEALLKPADDFRAASPDSAEVIDQWAVPFRKHLARLRAGDHYENGAWVTKADLEKRAQAEREAGFLRTLDYDLPAQALSAAEVRGLVFRAVAGTLGGMAVGLGLVVVFRRRKALRIAGVVLVAGSPLVLASGFFLATRTPPHLPAAALKDEGALVVAALADAAGLTPHPPAARLISEGALNFFVARYVHLKRPDGSDQWTAIREAVAARITPGRVSLFEQVRCAGLTWIIGYNLAFPARDASRIAVENVHVGALKCPPFLARLLWKNLEAPLAAIFAATKTNEHFAVQKPSLGAIQLISRTAQSAATEPTPAATPETPDAARPSGESPGLSAAKTSVPVSRRPTLGGYSNAGSDTWVATDALGRSMPDAAEVGPFREGKTVGILYYLWHGQHDKSAFDISRVLEKSPAAIHDWNDPAWGAPGGFHYWSEPLWGYYRADDEWVIRKNAQMLVDAGVDVVFFDVSNAFRYAEIYQRIGDVYAAIRAEGNRTPQIGFLTSSKSGEVAQALYEEFYARDLHPELWFKWEGKPLILARPGELSAALRAFFTVRESAAGKPGAGRWPWLEDSPQQGGQDPDGKLEQAAVAPASQPNNNVGKSFSGGKEPTIEERRSGEGRRFAEQWKHALDLNPSLIFVTQWNEWVAQRYKYDGPGQEYAGRPLKTGEPWFIDGYDPEFNRDIEPMKGGYEDNFYYQLAQNIRRFKGARTIPASPGPVTIATAGDWESVIPAYFDDRGDTFHRDSPGADPATTYKNDWGRNDIVEARVAADADHLFFLAKTAAPLTTPAAVEGEAEPTSAGASAGESPDPTETEEAEASPASLRNAFGTSANAPDDHWMQLLIDADKNPATGWFGYDYVINRLPADADGAVVERFDAATKAWVRAGSATQQVNATHLALTIPRKLLPEITGKPLVFDFKWADNVPLDEMKSPAEFSLFGDVAPNARFNYRFIQN